jgi:hypothetical protein
MDILEIGNNGHSSNFLPNMILKWNGKEDEVYLSWQEWQRVLTNNGIEFSLSDFRTYEYLNYETIKNRYNFDFETSGDAKANPN